MKRFETIELDGSDNIELLFPFLIEKETEGFTIYCHVTSGIFLTGETKYFTFLLFNDVRRQEYQNASMRDYPYYGYTFLQHGLRAIRFDGFTLKREIK